MATALLLPLASAVVLFLVVLAVRTSFLS